MSIFKIIFHKECSVYPLSGHFRYCVEMCYSNHKQGCESLMKNNSTVLNMLSYSQFFINKYVQVYGWIDDLRCYALFNSISVISGRWADNNERLCAMDPNLRLRRFCLERDSNSGR